MENNIHSLKSSNRIPLCAMKSELLAPARIQLHNPDVLDRVSSDFVVIDFETTGFSRIKDRIIELSAHRYKNGVLTDTYTTLVNPQRPIPKSSVEIHGITDEMVTSAPFEYDAMKKLLSFIGTSVIAAHNADFDIGFLKEAYCRCGMFARYKYIDTLEIAHDIYELPNYKLVTVAKHLGIASDNFHRASDDCAVCAAIVLDAVHVYSRACIPHNKENCFFDFDEEYIEAINRAVKSERLSPRNFMLHRTKNLLILKNKFDETILKIKPNGKKKHIIIRQSLDELHSLFGDKYIISDATTSTYGYKYSRIEIDSAADVAMFAPCITSILQCNSYPSANNNQMISKFKNAQYSADELATDHKAITAAKFYYEEMNMSKHEVYERLVSEYSEQFTEEEAQYAIDHLDD